MVTGARLYLPGGKLQLGCDAAPLTGALLYLPGGKLQLGCDAASLLAAMRVWHHSHVAFLNVITSYTHNAKAQPPGFSLNRAVPGATI